MVHTERLEEDFSLNGRVSLVTVSNKAWSFHRAVATRQQGNSELSRAIFFCTYAALIITIEHGQMQICGTLGEFGTTWSKGSHSPRIAPFLNKPELIDGFDVVRIVPPWTLGDP